MMTTAYTNMKFAVLAAIMAVALVAATPAHATFGEFAPVGEISVLGGGELLEGIAVDESTNDVYVYDGEGRIFKYDADGNPVDFSSLGTNAITGAGSYGSGETELAVDNSNGPAKGDIYLAAQEEIKIYGPDGKPLGKLTQVSGRPWGEACGVAVDGSGNVYVGLYPETIEMYKPSGNPVVNSDYVGFHAAFSEICEIAADQEGRVYATTWSSGLREAPAVRLDSFQAGGTEMLFSDAAGTVTAADAPSAEVFVNQKGEIRQYDATGDLLSTFGAGTEYRALSFNAKNGRLYAFDFGISRRKVQIWQGQVLPEIRTLRASGLGSAGTASLNGSVDPEGASIESCSFQYGPTPSYGAAVPCAQGTPLTGSSVLPVSAGVTGLTLNHTYHYRLSTTDPHGELNGSDQTFSVLVLPLVEDEQPSVSQVTRSTAMLEGSVDPEQGETRTYFEYGPTESYGNSTTVVHSGDMVSGDVPIDQEVVGLIPKTLYHYRLVATNVAGTSHGADHTFMSGESALPGAVTGAATEVAQNTATITGTVDTNGLPTSYGFEISTTTDYGPPTGLGYVGAGSAEAPAALALTGLRPGTTYHYRLTASNVDGTIYGADRTFTTSVYSSSFAEPPAPLPFVAVPAIAFPAETKVSPTKKKATKKKAKPKSKKRKRKAAAKRKTKRKR